MYIYIFETGYYSLYKYTYVYALFPVFKTTTLLRTNTKPDEQQKKGKENQDEESNMQNILSTNNGSRLVPALNLQQKCRM